MGTPDEVAGPRHLTTESLPGVLGLASRTRSPTARARCRCHPSKVKQTSGARSEAMAATVLAGSKQPLKLALPGLRGSIPRSHHGLHNRQPISRR